VIGPRVLKTSMDGARSAISAADYNEFMVGLSRSGTTCECGGDLPLSRVLGKRLQYAMQAAICDDHEVYVLVNTVDLPFRAARPPVATAATAPRAIKDWPSTCPRCGRAESAIALFSSMECRHGCFARGVR
jgi:hypothetical protein